MVAHLGYQPIGLQRGVRDALPEAITTDVELVKESQKRLGEVEIVPDEKLTPKQLTHLRLARAIADRVTRFFRPVSAVHAAIIPAASDRMSPGGMYARTTREIYISLDQLEYGRTTVDTVIHELAHHLSGAEDGEKAHYKEMTRIAALVVEYVARGLLDDYLKGVEWVRIV